MRVSETFPGEQGKDRIITAYLNEIFYGHGAYGIAAAALIYFGVSDLAKLTPAQAALLAGLPKSPSTLDPYRYAVRDDEGRLVVPPDAPPVVRRDWILGGLGEGARWTKLTQTELAAARAEPVVLAGEQALTYKAAHFTWQVRRQLDDDPRQRREGRDRRLQGHHHARHEGPGPRREVADRGRDRPQRLAQEGRRPDEVAQDPQGGPLVGPGPARQGPAQRRAGRPRLPDGRRAGLRRQRRLLPRQHDQQEVLAEVRRGRRRFAPARLGVQADPLRGGLQRQGADPGQPAARRDDRVQPPRGLGAARRRPARARTGPRAQGAPVLAQHPGHPDPRAGRQQPGRQDRRGARPALHRRARGVPAIRPGRCAWARSRSGRST